MIFDRFAKLIDYLVTCNGSCRKELEKKVSSGEVTKEEADIIYYYAEMKRLGMRLDHLTKKIQTV